jgi:lipopolysaccharide export system protein LptA
MIQPKVKSLCYILFTLISISCYALPDDKEKVMQVLSDSANLNQLQHKGTYTGNVQFVQGTTNLHASKAITHGDEKNQLTLAIVSGSKNQQAHYWTETEANKPPFHAYANIIKYYPLKHLIELIGNARVEQGPNSLSAAKIKYDTLKQRVLSESDGTTRTTIIFYPEKN